MKKFILIALIISSSVFAQSPTRDCAVISTGVDSAYHNHSFKVPAGLHINNLNDLVLDFNQGTDWDNKISKVKVFDGCTFIGYQYQDYNIDYNTGAHLKGFVTTLENNSSFPVRTFVLDGYTNNKISSLKCFCL